MLSLAPIRPPAVKRSRQRLPIRTRAGFDLQEASALVGKGLGLFVLFTTSMNWWTYRRIREDIEKKNKD
jgi:hypothetical protein